ncbi:MAG TPA: hypothetical protein VFR70_10860 [Flavobacterium sp.]|nr:hypothetical protein [Flavobacterium sp.]
MKQKHNFFRIACLVYAFLVLMGCSKEDASLDPGTTAQYKGDIRFKKITFRELKSNRRAFDEFKDARLRKNPALRNSRIYDENYGVFIDTANIIRIEKDGRHSITMQIVGEPEDMKIENLVLNSREGGGYDAYIAEYRLSQQELNTLMNGVRLRQGCHLR